MKLLYAATLLLAALLSDGSLPVLAAESHNELKQGSLPILFPLHGHRFLHKELTDNRLPASSNAAEGHSFSYEGPHGPDHWAEEWEACGGKYQSPIDIEEHLVQPVSLPPLVFHGFDQLPVSSTLMNNGHTVMLQMKFSRPAWLTGGPLLENYMFEQLHFHWGNNDSLGSENQVNNHTFPLEMHIVTYKEKYGSFSNAQHHRDGLAVLAVFFEIYGKGNPEYSEITSMLSQVEKPNSQVHLQRGVRLLSLLPEVRHLYFTYYGSLTTPPCYEAVTWIDFKQPVLLNHDQVKGFHTIYSPEGLLTFNFRPVQALSDRTVFFNVDYTQRVHNSAVSSFVTSFVLGAFLVLMLGVLLQ